jgi:hypothetical protein
MTFSPAPKDGSPVRTRPEVVRSGPEVHSQRRSRVESVVADVRLSTREATLNALQDQGIEFISERDGTLGGMRR